MSDLSREPVISAKAARSAYLVLAGPWFALAGFVTFVAWLRPGSGAWVAALLTLAVGLLVVSWLSGFRLTLSGGVLEYRSGTRQRTRVLLSDITAMEFTVMADPARRGVATPKLVAFGRDGAILLLANAKVFELRDLRHVLEQAEPVSADGAV